jgi:hypothetical protein
MKSARRAGIREGYEEALGASWDEGGGKMTGRVRDPSGRMVRAPDAGGIFRANPALPSSEAQIELLYRAGLRGLFRLNWAVPTSENRATKHPNFLKSRLG